MRYYLLWVCFIGTCLCANAQTPQALNYQAVARDAANEVLKNTALGIKMSILQNGDTLRYSESHSVTTSDIGIFSLKIGLGSPLSGDFSMIDWSGENYSIQIEIDPTGGNDYVTFNTSPLLSVPFALFSENTRNRDDADADSLNEIQNLRVEGRTLSISGGNSITLPIIDTLGMVDSDTDPSNEIQNLTSSRTDSSVTLDITGGGSSTIFSILDGDSDPANEIQIISKTADTVRLSNGGGLFIDATEDGDSDPLNEIQTISKIGDTVTLSVNGGSFIDATQDADNNPTNEIQKLEKFGSVVTLSNNGGSFIDAVLDADADTTNELQHLSLLTFADSGIEGTNTYQLKLSGSDQNVILPIIDLWKASITNTNPPTISSILTRFPVEISEKLNVPDITSVNLKTNDIVVGDPEELSTQISPGEIYFARPSLDPGFKITPDGISYTGNSLTSEFTNTSLTMKMNEHPTAVLDGSTLSNSGSLSLFSPAFNTPFFETYLELNHPYINLYDGENILFQATRSNQNAGTLNLFGPNGEVNVSMSNRSNFPNNGFVSVFDQNGAAQAGIFVRFDGTGEVFADNFNMVSPNPVNQQENIVYGSIHGPEVSVFERGTAQLLDGEATIVFPDHFHHLITDQKMTVMITPLSADSKGIAVIEKTTKGFKVKELLRGAGSYSFDWEVKAIRKGFENHKIFVKKEYAKQMKVVKE